MKQLRTILTQKTQENQVAPETKEKTKQEQLEDAIKELSDIKPDYERLNDTYTKNKDIVKNLLTELNLEKYESSGLKVNITHVDKSYLEEGPVIDYLKKNNLDKFIKTKEYFDEAEIAMAIANNELNAADLSQFIVKKEQINLYIKEAKGE